MFPEERGGNQKDQSGVERVQNSVGEMKTPRLQTEKVVINHIGEVHYGSVVVYGGLVFPECPRAVQKYIGEVPDILHPFILKHLEKIIVDKAVVKGIRIETRGNENENNYGDEL
jgi:hypothetical protein